MLHCRGPYLNVQKVTREKGTPAPTPDKGKTERGSIYDRLPRIVLCAATRRLERGKRWLQGVSNGALYFSRSSFYSFSWFAIMLMFCFIPSAMMVLFLTANLALVSCGNKACWIDW